MPNFFKAVFLAIGLGLAPAVAAAQDFPLTIEHKFGTTIIEEKPEIVASVDYAGADNLLALGVQPALVRYWYGDYTYTVFPWGQDELSTEPPVLRGDIDFEQVAAVEPDVIIALWSGIDADDYEKLSSIAPVVAVPEGVGDYALPWDERAMITGRAIGKESEAAEQVQAIRNKLAQIAASHPEWEGKTVAVSHAGQGPQQPSVYTSNDIRSQLFAEMGFETPQAVDDLIVNEGDFVVSLSAEDLSPLDADLLVWATATDWENVRAMAGRPFLAATREGRDMFIEGDLYSAFGHASLLSLPYAIEGMVPMIEAALDGDPATYVDHRPDDMAWEAPAQ